MTDIARSQQVFSQIEFCLKEAKYEYAEALLFELLNQNPSDRESKLYLLLVNVTREGPVLYEEDIDQLRNLSNLNDREKEIVRRLLVLGFKSAKKEGREDQILACQQLLTRLQLNQPLELPILRSSARTPPARQEPALKLIDRTLDLARLKAISLGWLVALLEKTSSVCQIWLSRASQTIWKLKVSRHTALAIAAVALLMIPMAYFSLRQDATETSGYANATLSQPMLANSVLEVGPIEPSRQHNDAESNKRDRVHIVTRQLPRLQRAYGNLMGSLLFKMELDRADNVVKVEDVASRLAVWEFRKVVLTEARKWNFHNANLDAAEFTVPFRFVPSEMHSETIVRWEQTLDSSKTEAKAMLPVYITPHRLDERKSKSTIQANPRTAGLKVAQAVETDGSRTQKFAGKPDQGIEYRTRRVVPLRQEPRYGSPKTQDIDAGATISVLETKGDWLKVETGPSGTVGYIRKEYVAPLTTSQ